MNVHEKVASLEAQISDALTRADGIVQNAKAEGRSLTKAEDRDVREYIADVEAMKPKLKAAREAAGETDDLRSKVGASDGWKTVARGLARLSGGGKVTVELGDLLGKDVVTPPTTEMGISRRAGIQPLQEDLRRMFQALPTSDPGIGTLHIEHLEIASHGVASGTVERDPLSETTKAEVDVDINYESMDMKSFAAKASGIPQQLFASEPQLAQMLQATIGLELDEALDSHVYKTLDDHAGIAVVSGGSDFQTKLRRSITDLRKNGATASVAFVSDADMETMDNFSAQDESLPRDYPWGLTLIPSPLLQAGEFFTLDPSGVLLHRAGAQFMRDPFSGMAENTERVRLEFNALCEVIEPLKVIASAASLVT
jgi:hypothetical protein